MLHRSIPLSNGLRVSLRLPHGSDRRALGELHARAGRTVDDVALTRLLRVDPRRRAAICATAWMGSAPALVGFAAGDLDAAAPDVLVVDEAGGPELAALLAQALRHHTSRVA